MIFESNTADFQLSKSVVGFSGYKTKNNREKIRSQGSILRITDTSLRILIYHNPAVMDYHLPQDSVGVHLSAKGITLGLADGVSLVHKTLDNDSAVLSHHIVTRCSKLMKPYWTKQLEGVCTSFKNRHYIGASTTVWGRITKESATTKLKTLFVGEQYDMGIARLITEKGLVEISNASSGFAPTGYKPSTEELFLPTPYTLCISRDGVALTDQSWAEFSRYKLFSKPLADVVEFLTEIIEPNRDDQSLLLISSPLSN